MAIKSGAAPELRMMRAGAIAWIVADNPSRMNAYTTDMWAAFPRLVREAEADPSVRVIVLRGAGEAAFSAGADISQFESLRSGDQALTYDELNHAAFAALLGCTKPTVAAIHGFCLGGGLAIALCCDLRYADTASQFAIPAAKLGIGYNPRWVAPVLRAVAPAFAKELLFTGRRVSAPDALAMGLLNRVMPAGDLMAFVTALATEIGGNAPLAIAAAKQAIDELHTHPAAPDLARLDALVSACFASEDYAEGRRAFLEKRRPVFRGR